eukprot:COSAG01_NODE_6309_length_3745_cov_1.422655_2_plen_305_part_00
MVAWQLLLLLLPAAAAAAWPVQNFLLPSPTPPTTRRRRGRPLLPSALQRVADVLSAQRGGWGVTRAHRQLLQFRAGKHNAAPGAERGARTRRRTGQNNTGRRVLLSLSLPAHAVTVQASGGTARGRARMSAVMSAARKQRALDARLKLCATLRAYMLELQGPQAVQVAEKKAIDHGGMQVLGKKSREDEDIMQVGKRGKKGKKKGKGSGGNKGQTSVLQHSVIRLTAFTDVGLEPPKTAAQLGAALEQLEVLRAKFASGELEVVLPDTAAAAAPPEPEQQAASGEDFLASTSAGASVVRQTETA